MRFFARISFSISDMTMGTGKQKISFNTLITTVFFRARVKSAVLNSQIKCSSPFCSAQGLPKMPSFA